MNGYTPMIPFAVHANILLYERASCPPDSKELVALDAEERKRQGLIRDDLNRNKRFRDHWRGVLRARQESLDYAEATNDVTEQARLIPLVREAEATLEKIEETISLLEGQLKNGR